MRRKTKIEQLTHELDELRDKFDTKLTLEEYKETMSKYAAVALKLENLKKQGARIRRPYIAETYVTGI